MAMLKTVPVYGTHAGRRERVATGLALAAGLDALDGAEPWRDLTVERKDLESYFDWLRSLW